MPNEHDACSKANHLHFDEASDAVNGYLLNKRKTSHDEWAGGKGYRSTGTLLGVDTIEEGGASVHDQPQRLEQQTDQTILRRIRVDHWQRMSPAQRDAFAAHVLTGWTAGQLNEAAPCYTRDAAEAMRLLAEVALSGHITGFALEFNLLPQAWSVFVDVPICLGMTVQEHTVGNTFCEAVVMALLRAYDVDFLTSDDDNRVGTLSQRRTVNALLKHASHALTDDLQEGWYDDLVRALGRFRRLRNMPAYDLIMWLYAALEQLRSKEIGQSNDDSL